MKVETGTATIAAWNILTIPTEITELKHYSISCIKLDSNGNPQHISIYDGNTVYYSNSYLYNLSSKATTELKDGTLSITNGNCAFRGTYNYILVGE